ncbi:low affinity iron permease family protein [Microtetraspora niveoalba]|uniref:low affinity iron permease family protein n=1 Tax=Microtetraspora niveoalba TaxID=46175 RepID=UPI00082D4892|nr:low affinity iron permease family protein [Microtetraspora niveoalba]
MKTRDTTKSTATTATTTTAAQPGDYSTRVTRFVGSATTALGSFPAIVAAVFLVALWVAGAALVPGGFGNQLYELVLNTVTNIVTFVMVFIIQSSQNRDSRAIQAKLDAQTEVLAAMAANLDIRTEVPLTRFVGLEEAPDRTIRVEQQTLREHLIESVDVDVTDTRETGAVPDTADAEHSAGGSGGPGRSVPTGDSPAADTTGPDDRL